MKIGALGDTHGRVKWKEIVNSDKTIEKWVFIGDYFDTHHSGVSGNRQAENFKDILAFKKANPDKVFLILGNHDYHYLTSAGETYSGFQSAYALEFNALLEPAIKEGLLQVAYLHDTFLFTHAGLTKTWTIAKTDIPEPIIVNDEMVQTLNDYLIYKPNVFKFNTGPNFSRTGDDITQGPIWVRKESLKEDMVEGVTCVVGHTPVRQVTFEWKDIIMIDCLGDTYEYLIIDNGKPSVGRVNITE